MAGTMFSYVIEEGIAVITINNPPVNALDQKRFLESGQVINELRIKAEARIITCCLIIKCYPRDR